MGRLQVLVATMHQTDFSLIEKMNIRADVIIANQADYEAVSECSFGSYHAKMITTRTRGVGVNRNIALQAADAEIVLFADDDICYKDDAFNEVLRAFDTLPQTDLIAFGADITKNGAVTRQIRHPIRRRHIWNSMAFGAAFLAARRESVCEKKIAFSELFGGGCMFGSGEDTMFLKECLANKLVLFSHSYVLGSCASDVSSWFEGYREKYFYDKGAWTAAAFPKTKFLMKWYFMFRLRKLSQIPFKKMLYYFNLGLCGYAARRPYSEELSNT